MSTTANAIAITDRISKLPKEYDQARIDALNALKDEVLATLAVVEEETRATTRRALGEMRSSGAVDGVEVSTGDVVTDAKTAHGPVDSAESQADGQHLSGTDRAALFSGLQATLEKAENRDGISDKWSAIEQALMKNPSMMRNLKRLQDMGAELVVTDFQEGRYVEFADAAVNLDIRKQEETLAGLAAGEKDDAIEQILRPLSEGQKESARRWILSQLSRPHDVRGLNWVEALVLAVAHGGTLITHEAYDAMARKDKSIVGNVTWTWYLKNLSDVMQSGGAPDGCRHRGVAGRREYAASDRNDDQGVRVAGLRVPIAA